jgi:hypothetical protein
MLGYLRAGGPAGEEFEAVGGRAVDGSDVHNEG